MTQNLRYSLWITFKHFIRYDTKIRLSFSDLMVLIISLSVKILSNGPSFPVNSFSNFVNSSLTFQNLLDALSVLFNNDFKIVPPAI